MADDFELTIRILAVDEASSVVSQFAAELDNEFTAIVEEAGAAVDAMAADSAYAVAALGTLESQLAAMRNAVSETVALAAQLADAMNSLSSIAPQPGVPGLAGSGSVGGD